MQLGDAYRRAGRTPEAIRAYTRVVDEFPESAYVSDARPKSTSSRPNASAAAPAEQSPPRLRRRRSRRDSRPSWRMPIDLRMRLPSRRPALELPSMTRPLRIVVVDDPLATAHTLGRRARPPRLRAGRPRGATLSRRWSTLPRREEPWDLLVVSALHPDGLADHALDWVAPARARTARSSLSCPGEVAANDEAVLKAVRGGARDYVGSDDEARFVAAVVRELARPDRPTRGGARHRRPEPAAARPGSPAGHAEDGGGGPPRRRHRPRLQQPRAGDRPATPRCC